MTPTPLLSTAVADLDLPKSIATNHDAMIILTQSYPADAVIRVVDAHTKREVSAALARSAAPAPAEICGLRAQIALAVQQRNQTLDELATVHNQMDHRLSANVAADEVRIRELMRTHRTYNQFDTDEWPVRFAKAVWLEAIAAALAAPASDIAAAPEQQQDQALVDLMPKRAAFIAYCEARGYDTSVQKDDWGAQLFTGEGMQKMWEGWFNAPAVYATALDSVAAPGSATAGAAAKHFIGYYDEDEHSADSIASYIHSVGKLLSVGYEFTVQATWARVETWRITDCASGTAERISAGAPRYTHDDPDAAAEGNEPESAHAEAGFACICCNQPAPAEVSPPDGAMRIYQVYDTGGGWMDVAKEQHDRCNAKYRRAVYRAAQPAEPVDGAMPEQELLTQAATLLENSMFQSLGQADRAEKLAAKIRKALAAQPAEGILTPEQLKRLDKAEDRILDLLKQCQPAEGSAQVALQARSPEGDPWQEVSSADFFKAHANGYEVSMCVHSPGENSIRLEVAAPERSDTPAGLDSVQMEIRNTALRAALAELQSFVNDLNDGSAGKAFYDIRAAVIAYMNSPTAASKALDIPSPTSQDAAPDAGGAQP